MRARSVAQFDLTIWGSREMIDEHDILHLEETKERVRCTAKLFRDSNAEKNELFQYDKKIKAFRWQYTWRDANGRMEGEEDYWTYPSVSEAKDALWANFKDDNFRSRWQ